MVATVPVFGGGTSAGFRGWSFVFLGTPCDLSQPLGRLNVPNTPPFVRRFRSALAHHARQTEQVRQAKLASAGSAPLRHLDKAERFKLTDRRSYRVAMNPVFHELLVGDRQLAIIVTAVVG